MPSPLSPSTSSSGGGESPPSSINSIVSLNVGGCRFATSRQTLTWIPDTFFTSLLSGRVPTVRDDTGAIFIDRDPDVFRVILNYLRTKQIDISAVDHSSLKHEALFFGLTPLVKRLQLCEELEISACGSVFFHGIIQPPLLPIEYSSHCDQSRDGSHARAASADIQSASSSCCSSVSGGVNGGGRTFKQSHYKHGSVDLNKFIRNELSALKLTQKPAKTSMERKLEREHELDVSLPLRVRLLRPHHNSLAVAYPNYVAVYRMKESVGWQQVYMSAKLKLSVTHIALNTKFGPQTNEKMLSISFSDGSIDLWNVTEAVMAPGGGEGGGGAMRAGKFSLDVPIDKLFFIGSQLVALSNLGKVGIWHSTTQNWQVQDVGSTIACYDTAGSSLILGCTNGSMYYVDMQKFPLRMKDNDLLVTELYRDPNGDAITAISVYLTPKTTICGNWIEIAYGTSSGAVRVIVQHPETVGHGPQLFQTYTVHASPIVRVALSTNHLISVCAEYNHVRSWGVTRFRGMISTQPGSTSLASFKVLTLESTDESQNDYADAGPYGDQEGDQVFVQRVVPDTNQLFIRLASNGDRLCTIKSVDGAPITSFVVHECEGSTRIGCRPRRFLFTGTSTGSVQMWDLTTALDQYYASRGGTNGPSTALSNAPVAERGTTNTVMGLKMTPSISSLPSSLLAALAGPTPQELLALIDECELSCSGTSCMPTPYSSTANLPGLASPQQ
ncbi:hypothetical protein PRIPAC_70512 [Pristionchus pacificus]|uniref:BTB domain-containing protein n=1 Tax=Pristionchus pacificus TaxID=54126 RepID=A0A2A6C9Z3_PRIPA|nr:hypothetical protein PRIPAC_70512 [Pristionchus pacificus]|eukprot:PDM75004.1 hypothetical protein PRIPAC_40385 [Pristionchus pacificus]